MNFIEFDNPTSLGKFATSIVQKELIIKPDLLFCAATGNSPKPLYSGMREAYETSQGFYNKMRVIPLDEWLGLPTSEGSCDTFIRNNILIPLNIPEERYFPFNPAAKSLEKECERIQSLIKNYGPIDLCILGLGKNGHLGLNEPATSLMPNCHIANLSKESQNHTMINQLETRPTKGITLGIEEILASKKIVLIVSGKGKTKALSKLKTGNIDPCCPATYLHKHENVDCLILKTSL